MKKITQYVFLGLASLSVTATAVAASLGIGGCPLCWGRKLASAIAFLVK